MKNQYQINSRWKWKHGLLCIAITTKGYLKCSKCPFLSSAKEALCILLSFHLLL